MELLAAEVDLLEEKKLLSPVEVEKFVQTLSSIVGSRIRDRKYKNKIQKMADRASSFWLTHVQATKLIKNFSKLTAILL